MFFRLTLFAGFFSELSSFGESGQHSEISTNCATVRESSFIGGGASVQLPIEFKENYLQRRKDDLETSLVSLSHGDFTKVAQIGHQIKGNAHTFGHDRLADIAERLEAAAQERDSAQVRYLLRLFSSWIMNES